MSEKFIKTRVTQKHDTESNWLKTSFVPNQGELIIYDIEENVSSYERIKIGDGIHNINELPFVTDIEIPQSDWQQNDPSAPDYIKNRLAYIDSKTLTYDGSLDEYLSKGDMPEDIGGAQYLVRLLDTPIDLYSVTKIQIVTAHGYSEMFELNGENSRIEFVDNGLDPIAYTLYISYSGMELPVLSVCELWGTATIYYESVYGGITCWVSYIEYDEVIHQIDQKFIPDTMATDEEVVNMIDSHNTDTSAHDDIRQLISKKLIYNDKTLTPEQQTQARENIGAMSSDTEIPSIEGLASEKFVTDKIAAIPTPDVSGQIGSHNTATDSHNDIRLLVSDVATRLNALSDSDDETLDQMSEIVAYIRSNKNLIDAITTGKVSVTDIINNLTTNVANKPLSAAQGVALKALIDAIVVPTKVSELTNDKGYLTSYTESDPTVPAWAKAAKKPSYTKSEVGLGNVDNVKQYSKNNPPVVAQPTPPTDTSVVWVDTSDEYMDEFSEAVNMALAQAKASGEFNPVKGVDYWTDADQEAIVQESAAVVNQSLSNYIPVAQGVGNAGKILMVDANGNLSLCEMPDVGMSGDIVGVVSENNEIVLTGALPEGVYTIKYEMENGEFQDIGIINLESEVVVPMNLLFGKIDYNNNGAIVSSDTYLYSGFIENGKSYIFSLIGEGSVCSVKLAYYDADGNYIGISEKNFPDTAYGTTSTGAWSLPVPAYVAKFRLRIYHSSPENAQKTLVNAVLTKRNIRYTNLLPAALGSDGSVLNGTGYINDKKPSSYPNKHNDAPGYFCTGFIPYTIAQITARIPLYVKGVDIDLTSLDGNILFGMTTEATSTDWMGVKALTDMSAVDQYTIVQLGTNYYTIIPNANARTAEGWNKKDMKYIRISLPGSGEGVIITVDEPIL